MDPSRIHIDRTGGAGPHSLNTRHAQVGGSYRFLNGDSDAVGNKGRIRVGGARRQCLALAAANDVALWVDDGSKDLGAAQVDADHVVCFWFRHGGIPCLESDGSLARQPVGDGRKHEAEVLRLPDKIQVVRLNSQHRAKTEALHPGIIQSVQT